MPTPTADHVALAARLRTARQDLRLTQDDAAKKLGVGRGVIAEIEGGNRKVGALELRDLAHLYGVPVMALLGDDPPAPVVARNGGLEGVLGAVRQLDQVDQQVIIHLVTFLACRGVTR